MDGSTPSLISQAALSSMCARPPAGAYGIGRRETQTDRDRERQFMTLTFTTTETVLKKLLQSECSRNASLKTTPIAVKVAQRQLKCLCK